MEKNYNLEYTIDVYSTTNYDMFKLYDANRDISNIHVQKLVRSILEKNLLKQIPIVVDKDFYVIDGQHRLEVAKKINKKIYFYIVTELSMEDIARMNTFDLNWKSNNILQFQIYMDNPNYIKFFDFMKNNEINNITTALSIFASDTNCNGSHMIFRFGNFKYPTNDKYAYDVIKLINEFKVVYPEYQHNVFIKAISKMIRHPEFDKKNLLRKLNNNVLGGLHKVTTVKNYIDQFSRILNHGSHKIINLW